jgi:hypothetical protein
MAAALLTACGSDISQDGSGSASASGAGGAGSSSSAGGSGGGAGGSDEACSPELKDAATLNGPDVGFNGDPSGPGTAAVQAIDPDGIDLSLGPGAPLLRFRWIGPDLGAAFTKGEIVKIGVSAGWHLVTGEKARAATITEESFVSPELLPEIPDGGPAIGFSTQCSFQEASGACGSPPSEVEMLALEAASAGAASSIPHGATASVGAWQIHNAIAVQYPGYGDQDCILEAAYLAVVTALEAKTPP